MTYKHSRPRKMSKKNARLWKALDREWRELLVVRKRFREGEASAMELDNALEKLKRAERRIGSCLLDEERLRYPINWGG
jgi:hypothetical protein